MKKLVLALVLLAVLLTGYFYLSAKQEEVEVKTPVADSVPANEVSEVYFDFSYEPPDSWEVWEGISASMSTFVNGDKGYDPSNLEDMQEYINSWSADKTDILVFIKKDNDEVDTQSRDYTTVLEYNGAQVDDPLYYDDMKMVLYDKEPNISEEESVSEIHTRRPIIVAGVEGDYFRMKSKPSHDSVNFSILYEDKTITFYKLVPKSMSDTEVEAILEPFVEKLPLGS